MVDPENGHFVYRFGRFELDPEQKILRNGERTIPIVPRAFDVLACLLVNSNSVVDKDTLIREVWKGAFVEEANIGVQISALRKLLSELDGGISIETIPKRGYRLVGSVSKKPAGDDRREVLPKPVRRNELRRKFLLIAIASVTIVLATGYVVDRFIVSQDARAMTTTRLLGKEKSVFFSISPNGEYMAHNLFADGKRNLMLTHIATNSGVQLIEPEDFLYLSITFTPDGNSIYFVRSKSGTPNTLYKVAILGGDPMKVLEGVDGRISFSPDGRRFAFYRRSEEQKTTSVMTAASDGSDEKLLNTLRHPDHFARSDVAWSPDGKTIVVGVNYRSDRREQVLAAVDPNSGEMRPLASRTKWASWESFAWLPDGSGLIAAIRTESVTHNHLFLIPYPEGEPVRLSPGDVSGFRTVSLSADGKKILAENYSHQTEIWHAGKDGTDVPLPLTSERHHFFRLIRWAPDGRIVFGSSYGGSRDIWFVERTGSKATKVTSDAGQNEMPFAAADNKHVVFVSNRLDDGVFNVWRSEYDGRNAVRLTNGRGEQFPVVSPDMKWVLYETTPMSTQPDSASIWKVPFEGGEPVLVAPEPSHQADVSPDGQYVACEHKPEPGSKWKLAIFSINGGPPVNIFDLPEVSPVRWMPDGKAVTYIRTLNGVANLWAQPIDGSPPYQVTRFTADGIPSYCDWSAEFGLVCSRGRVTRDAVVITDFR